MLTPEMRKKHTEIGELTAIIEGSAGASIALVGIRQSLRGERWSGLPLRSGQYRSSRSSPIHPATVPPQLSHIDATALRRCSPPLHNGFQHHFAATKTSAGKRTLDQTDPNRVNDQRAPYESE
jgi:hypothetical protein